MARVFATPIVLPADPASSNQASNKNYVDNGLAARVPTTRQVLAGTGLSGGGALSGDVTLTLAPGKVLFAPSTTTYATTISADPTVSNNFDVTATGNITSLGVSATGALNGQMVVIAVLASGAARTVTPATGTIGAQSIASGAVGFFGFRYTSLLATPVFVCISYQASA